MKIKISLLVLGAGLALAGCKDKEAEAKITQMEADMKKADSTCTAGMTMMQGKVDSMQMMLDSMQTAMDNMPTSTGIKSKPVLKSNVQIKKKPGGN